MTSLYVVVLSYSNSTLNINCIYEMETVKKVKQERESH